MTEVATSSQLGQGIVSHQNGLAFEDSLSFNDWRRLGEKLLITRERLSWSIGDWWAYGERFGRDYAHGVGAIESSERSYSFTTLREYARTCVAFPLHKEEAVAYRMAEELSFAHHHHVLSIPDPGERMRWLGEAIRQNWSVAALRDELRVSHAIQTRVDVLSVRVMDETYRLALEAAERRRMDPRVWCIEAIRKQAVREIPELAAGSGRV